MSPTVELVRSFDALLARGDLEAIGSRVRA
jgi:hypothetical protein